VITQNIEKLEATFEVATKLFTHPLHLCCPVHTSPQPFPTSSATVFVACDGVKHMHTEIYTPHRHGQGNRQTKTENDRERERGGGRRCTHKTDTHTHTHTHTHTERHVSPAAPSHVTCLAGPPTRSGNPFRPAARMDKSRSLTRAFAADTEAG
jgi:hypothetical protein